MQCNGIILSIYHYYYITIISFNMIITECSSAADIAIIVDASRDVNGEANFRSIKEYAKAIVTGYTS